jgi:succinate-semialdehyde dehydrogenase/glutarate-semialdehyde dehydrogenase
VSTVGVYVAGEWRLGAGQDLLPRTNPSTDEPLGQLTVAGDRDVADAVAAAHEAFGRWRVVAAHERAALLHRAAAGIRQRAAEFGRLIATELGNVLPAATFEAMVAADVLDWSAGEARRVYGRVIPSRFPATRQFALKEPIGPVFAACPWNMPLIFPARKIAEALCQRKVEMSPACATHKCPLQVLCVGTPDRGG